MSEVINKRFIYEHPVIKDFNHDLDIPYPIYITPHDLVEIANDLIEENTKLKENINEKIKI